MDTLHNNSAKAMRNYIERIERLEGEKAALSEDIKDVFLNAKATGFDVKVMRQVIKLRKQDPAARQDNEQTLAVYLNAMGMDDTPLGRWAAERAAEEN